MVQIKTNPHAESEEQPADKFVGQIIGGRYKIIKLLGGGPFFATYLVLNINDNKMWAMKLCDKTSKKYSLFIQEQMLKEEFMISKLQHHAIPQVENIIEDDEKICLVREYIEGETLETIVKQYGAQPADKVVEWGKQLCEVLGYLHGLTPPHILRDVKPANIVLKLDGTLKIIDFDIMRTYKQHQKGDTTILGTKGYAAPEQYGISQSDARTDIFALGMTMHHLVTGVDPRHNIGDAIPVCEINPKIPKGLEYIISKCTQKNPDERYQSCEELTEDLNNYMNLPKPKGVFGKLFGKK